MSGVKSCVSGSIEQVTHRTMMPGQKWFPVIREVAKGRLSGGKNNPDRALTDGPGDLSRFEEEAGPVAPVPATELVDASPGNSIGRKPHWASYIERIKK